MVQLVEVEEEGGRVVRLLGRACELLLGQLALRRGRGDAARLSSGSRAPEDDGRGRHRKDYGVDWQSSSLRAASSHASHCWSIDYLRGRDTTDSNQQFAVKPRGAHNCLVLAERIRTPCALGGVLGGPHTNASAHCLTKMP